MVCLKFNLVELIVVILGVVVKKLIIWVFCWFCLCNCEVVEVVFGESLVECLVILMFLVVVSRICMGVFGVMMVVMFWFLIMILG